MPEVYPRNPTVEGLVNFYQEMENRNVIGEILMKAGEILKKGRFQMSAEEMVQELIQLKDRMVVSELLEIAVMIKSEKTNLYIDLKRLVNHHNPIPKNALPLNRPTPPTIEESRNSFADLILKFEDNNIGSGVGTPIGETSPRAPFSRGSASWNLAMKAIAGDDVDELQRIVAQPQFDLEFTHLLPPAAAKGAIKCFRFLVVNGATPNEASLDSAIRSGNEEMIRVHEEYNVDFTNALPSAVMSFNNNIYDWLIEVKKSRQSMESMAAAIKTGNIRALLLSKIYLHEEMIECMSITLSHIVFLMFVHKYGQHAGMMAMIIGTTAALMKDDIEQLLDNSFSPLEVAHIILNSPVSPPESLRWVAENLELLKTDILHILDNLVGRYDITDLLPTLIANGVSQDTLLSIAIANNNLTNIKALFDSGAPIKLSLLKSEESILFALKNGVWFDQNVSQEEIDDLLRTAIMGGMTIPFEKLIARVGRLSDTLLDLPPQPVGHRFGFDVYPLPMVKHLLHYGVDPSRILVAFPHNSANVLYLLKAGAKVTSKIINHPSVSANFDCICAAGFRPEPQMMANFILPNPRQLLSVLSNHPDMVNLTYQGKTLAELVLSTYSPPPSLQLLLMYGADPNQQDSTGCPLLFKVASAVRQRNTTFMEDYYSILLQRGADPNIPYNGDYIIIEIIRLHILDCFIINSKVPLQVNVRNKNGETPLSVAKSAGNPAIVSILTSMGAID